MSRHQSEDAPAGEPGHTSVTRLTTPFVGSDPLPANLLAAFNLAAHAATNAHQVLFMSQLVTSSEGDDESIAGYARLIAESVQEIWAEYPYHDALMQVAKELADASEPGSHFGGASAHEAALSFADLVLDRVWWVADPMQYSQFRRHQAVRMDVRKVPDRLRSIAKELGRKKWPDGDALIRACQVEAARAAAKRDPGARPPSGPPTVPTIWFHGSRCYSADRVNLRTVSVEEDAVLQAFLWRKGTLDTAELEKECGRLDFARIVDSLRSRFDGLFAQAIERPAQKGSGGYRIRVRRVPRAK